MFDNVTVEVIKEKDEDIFNIAVPEVAKRVKAVRPYPGVISRMTIENLKISDKIKITKTDATVTAEFNSKVYTEDENISFTDSIVKYNLVISTTNDIIKVKNYSQTRDVLYTDYFNRDELASNVPKGRRVGAYLRDNYDKLTHVKYRFKGTSNINPIDTTERVYLDSFNLLYWVYKKFGIDIDYPLSVQYMLDTDNFTHVLLKGHKAKADIDSLIEGDIMFFDSNDSTIGIYTGDDSFVTLDGEFPQDTTSLSKYNISTWWDRFNGRVLRFEEDINDD